MGVRKPENGPDTAPVSSKIRNFGKSSQSHVGTAVCGNFARDMESLQDIQTASVAVLPCLREYILSVNDGSDIITPGRESRLWGIVKMHLDLVPEDYEPVPAAGSKDCIRIALFRSHRRQYNRNPHRSGQGRHRPSQMFVVDTLWRTYLNRQGQEAVASHLMHTFKLTFRSYMTGALGNSPGLTIHDAIYSFCELYGISMDTITYEMLRKDWFRFRKKHSGTRVIPVENSDF